MASNGYPKLPLKAWRTLRARAAAAPSNKFTPSTVAAMMAMANPTSARNNIVSPLRRVGLIDEDGALTARGNKWRVDASYPEACQEILDEVYPSDLTDLTDGSGAPDTQAVKTWFDHQGFGNSNARQMAATYVLIAGKEVPEPPAEQNGSATKKPAERKPSRRKAEQSSTSVEQGSGANQSQTSSSRATPNGPNVHLDIQIHIPSDATSEQIDQIFASMARHLYKQ